MVEVVFSEFCNVQRQVFLGGEDVVGFAVVVDVEGHVARHLTSGEVALDDESLVHGLAPGWCPVLIVEGA